MIGGGWLKLKPAQVTDDTEMALCIARSLAKEQRFNPNDIAQRFAAWYTDSPIGAGTATRAALQKIIEGTPWNNASDNKISKNSLGNGTIMRCAPLALFNYHSRPALNETSYDQALITHRNPACLYTPIFLNNILRNLLQGKNKQTAYQKALTATHYPTNLHKRYTTPPQHLSNLGTVLETLESALHFFMTTTHYEQAVLKAINFGGDTDTRGAICGALAGAQYGESAIPDRWKKALIDSHEHTIHGELCQLARTLHQYSTSHHHYKHNKT
jgi:ADP-ribosyl-[dinitrogen reductase] hydrolase